MNTCGSQHQLILIINILILFYVYCHTYGVVAGVYPAFVNFYYYSNRYNKKKQKNLYKFT